jgi:hypothetical protein
MSQVAIVRPSVTQNGHCLATAVVFHSRCLVSVGAQFHVLHLERIQYLNS